MPTPSSEATLASPPPASRRRLKQTSAGYCLVYSATASFPQPCLGRSGTLLVKGGIPSTGSSSGHGCPAPAALDSSTGNGASARAVLVRSTLHGPRLVEHRYADGSVGFLLKVLEPLRWRM